MKHMFLKKYMTNYNIFSERGRKMKLIAAVDKNWGIGRNNRLLVNIPEDMQLFRQETNGKVVIMGRKTFESLKEKSPLYGRKILCLRQISCMMQKEQLFVQVLKRCLMQ